MVIVVLGVGVRWVATFLISAKFNIKERMFVAFAWIPKATV